jgi:hypothetical protein
MGLTANAGSTNRRRSPWGFTTARPRAFSTELWDKLVTQACSTAKIESSPASQSRALDSRFGVQAGGLRRHVRENTDFLWKFIELFHWVFIRFAVGERMTHDTAVGGKSWRAAG